MTQSARENPILDAWAATLAQRGATAAVFGADGVSLRTFSEIEREAEGFSAQLEGLAPGAVVGVRLGNSPQWPAVLVALFRRALVPVPLGDHLGSAEFAAALALCDAEALVTPGSLEKCAGTGVFRAGSWSGAMPEFIKHTSGTSGTPRAILFTAAQLAADCAQVCDTMGIGPDDLNYGAIPVAHSYGFSNLLTPLLMRGVPVVATDDRMPRAVLAGLEKTGATVFPSVPAFYEKLAALARPPALPRLRLCVSAGAPLVAAAADAFTTRFGQRIHSFYGASECGGIAYDPIDVGSYTDGLIGPAIQGVSIEPLGSEGAIRIRGAAVGLRYFPGDEPSALGEGAFVPGDLASFTPRGLALAGRATDVINIAGRKLHPAEIERCLATCPGVREVIVFGIPSALRGEEPVACVVGDGIDRESLRRFCLAQLSPWQLPRDFWLVPELPASERGKTSRRALAQAFLNRHQS